MKTTVITSSSPDPYHNLALEELLLSMVQEDEIILYLWQNEKTIVIGRNQNAWQECDVSLFQKENGKIARRLSGGGAVYHDAGNQNFTFITVHKQQNVPLQLQVIQQAAASFGLHTEFTGRNDLAIEGKKFSGNAYYSGKTASYHHGTILIHASLEQMKRYLMPSRRKLQAKGVASVESRVVNLQTYNADITPASMRTALVQSFQRVYQSTQITCLPMPDPRAWLALEQKYRSQEWIFGRQDHFSQILEYKKDDALLSLHLNVREGIIEDVRVYTDALDPCRYPGLEEKLKGIRYVKEEVEQILQNA